MDTLIISGGNIGIDLALGLLKIKRFDHIIGVDGGLKFCYDHKIVPTRIVGDFDTLSPEILTWYKKNTQIEIREKMPQTHRSPWSWHFPLEVIMLRFLEEQEPDWIMCWEIFRACIWRWKKEWTVRSWMSIIASV